MDLVWSDSVWVFWGVNSTECTAPNTKEVAEKDIRKDAQTPNLPDHSILNLRVQHPPLLGWSNGGEFVLRMAELGPKDRTDIRATDGPGPLGQRRSNVSCTPKRYPGESFLLGRRTGTIDE